MILLKKYILPLLLFIGIFVPGQKIFSQTNTQYPPLQTTLPQLNKHQRCEVESHVKFDVLPSKHTHNDIFIEITEVDNKEPELVFPSTKADLFRENLRLSFARIYYNNITGRSLKNGRFFYLQIERHLLYRSLLI